MTTKVRDSTQINFDGMSTGQVGFLGASALTGDNGLFWDNTNKRLGIGTSSPLAKLEVVGVSQTPSDASTHFELSTGTGTYPGNNKLIFGIHDSDYSWLQAVKAGTNYLNLILNPSAGNVGIGVANPSTYGAILVAHAATDINFSVRTLAGIAGTGSGVGLDAVTDNAASATKMGFRATEFQFLTGKFSIYNSIATAGLGIPAIYASGRITGQTVGGTVVTFTPAADGSFVISGTITVTAYTSGTAALKVTWTDEGSNSNTLNIASNSAVGQGFGTDVHIRVKGGTTITVSTTNGVATYNAEGYIIQVG